MAAPKVTWGINEDTIADAESRQFVPYDGPELVHRAVYRFAVERIRRETSRAGNPMITLLLLADDDRDGKKEYNGAPVWDRVPVMASTAFRVRAFCDALGVTYKDFLTKTVTDGTEEDNITAIGPVKFGGKKPVHVKAQVIIGQDDQGQPRPEVATLLPKAEQGPAEPELETDEGEQGDAADYDEDARRGELEDVPIQNLRDVVTWLRDEQQWEVDPSGKRSDLIETIVEIEQADEFEGYDGYSTPTPEPEPEPAPPARKTAAKKTAAKKTAARRGAAPF
jgi:hypothetical protein